jgi:peptide/nickel transport system permease protein
MPASGSARLGALLLAGVALLAVVAPGAVPQRPSDQFADRSYAPPMRIRVHDATGWHLPFVYRQVLEDRLLRQYGEDRTRRVRLDWFTRGHVASVDPTDGPLLLLGADALGRDVFSRLLSGARRSLGVTVAGVLGALLVGVVAGGLAGGLGGAADRLLMLVADFIIVLPGAYLVLVLRGVMPLVLTPWQVFWLMAVLFAVAAWPHVARGVRSIVAVERSRDYVMAARAAGAGPVRLVRHLLPSVRGFLGVEIVLLVPALLVAEATISYLGLGFPEPTASWGTMLQEASNVPVMATAPWMLAPAAALFVVVLGAQLVGVGRASATVLQLGRAVDSRPVRR